MEPMNEPRRKPRSKDQNLGADAAWEEIRYLLLESNEPPDVTSERLKALRERALQRYAIEQPSMWAMFKERVAFWTEAVSARSAASRFLHLAAAGSMGALIALLVVLGPAPTFRELSGHGNRQGTGTALNTGGGQTQGSAPVSSAQIGGNTAAAIPGGSGSASGEIPVADATLSKGPSLAGLAATPSDSPVNRIDKSSSQETATTAESGPGGGAVSIDPGQSFMLAAAASQNSANDLYLSSPSKLINPLGVQTSAGYSRPSDSGSLSTRSADEAVLEDLAKLRFKFQINNDREYLSDVDAMQVKLEASLQSKAGSSAESQQYKALRLLNQAEKSAEKQRYIEAIGAYTQVAEDMPGTFYAFLAHYQIANIEYENLDQYGSALDQYRTCLENTPPQLITEDKRNQILSRVESLSQNSENNWEPLRLYTTAQKSSPPIAQQKLLELLEKYPESKLAGDSARDLANLAANDLEGKYVNPDRVLETLQKALNLNRSSSQAAEIQFAIGDILQKRLFKPGLAIPAYQEVLHMNPSTDLAKAARSRLRDLSLLRSVTPTP